MKTKNKQNRAKLFQNFNYFFFFSKFPLDQSDHVKTFKSHKLKHFLSLFIMNIQYM